MFRLMDDETQYKIDSGTSFCNVNKIRTDISGALGIHKWNGEKSKFYDKGCCD